MNSSVPCPQCGTPDPKQIKFSWWGGALGPRLLHHVKCVNCANKYNGKTGQSNTGSIVIYSVAIFVIAFALMFGLFFLRAFLT